MVANGLGGFHEKPLEQYAKSLAHKAQHFTTSRILSETTACVDAHAGQRTQCRWRDSPPGALRSPDVAQYYVKNSGFGTALTHTLRL